MAQPKNKPEPSAEDRLTTLLRRRRARPQEPGEKELIQLHLRSFIRRVRAFDRGFFPGGEKSEEAFTSLGHGAFVSFDKERIYEGAPAFDNVLDRNLPAQGYLYRWRASATVQYLKREGPEALRARFRLRRNVQIHLREGFEVVGLWRGQSLWAPIDVALPAQEERPDMSCLEVPQESLRGKALVREVLRAAGTPLTRDEIAQVLARIEGALLPQEVRMEAEAQVTSGVEAIEAERLDEQLEARADRFFARLSDKQRRLLLVRGWADDRPQVPFSRAAQAHGSWSEESCRQHERRLLEKLAKHFPDADELRAAGRRLAALLREMATKETV